MTTINLYSQFTYHEDAKIIGDREGLMALRDALNAALDCIDKKPCMIDVYASDGEGYTLSVICLDDDAIFPSPYYASEDSV